MNKQSVKSRLKGLENSEKIKFVKYQFTDMQGNIREVTITAESIKGEGSTSVDGSSVFGKIIPPTESDMLLIPDTGTLTRIPWDEDTARIVCDVYHPPEKEGKKPVPFEGCPRSILKHVEKSLQDILSEPAEKLLGKSRIAGFAAEFAPEVEFILVHRDYDVARLHLDQDLRNDNYFVPPKHDVDKALKEMVSALASASLRKEKYHTEVTSYQCEIGIGHYDASGMADATMFLKTVIERVAQLNGLKASFIPKFRKGVNGSGMHVHQNLAALIRKAKGEKRVNLFFDKCARDGLSDIGRSYIAGLLKYAPEITALTNPIPLSYKRLVPGCEAPTYIAWDWQNRTALCRGHSPGTHKVRVEYRAPDPKCNPYLAFAAMLAAGLEGIEQGLTLKGADKRNFYKDSSGVRELPANLGEALERMNESEMLRKRLGGFIIDKIYELQMGVWKEHCQEVTDMDIKRNF
ncbi:glutamine synthetase [Candidatus Woesearchaeota archaeon]|nr:glutamine synthetase [Candidatus Woesearchaeota archaeon]